MSCITKELREWARGLNTYNRNELQVLAIADRIDAVLAEHYIELPMDADGAPIHFGDMVVDINEDEPFTLEEATLNKLGWTLSGSAYGEMYEPTQCRHYHAPTVEDVLHSFICDVEEDVRDEREIIAEYAAKLRLRGEDE